MKPTEARKNHSIVLVISAILCVLFCLSVSAHSGRTDSRGGHYDRSTGEYHYHHGYSAHQHPGGICPYLDDADSKSPSNDAYSSRTTGNKYLDSGKQSVPSTVCFALVYLLPCALLIPIVHVALGKSKDEKIQDFVGLAPIVICSAAYIVSYAIVLFGYSNAFYLPESNMQKSFWHLTISFAVLLICNTLICADKKGRFGSNVLFSILVGLPWYCSLFYFPCSVLYTTFIMCDDLGVNGWVAVVSIAAPIVVHVLWVRAESKEENRVHSVDRKGIASQVYLNDDGAWKCPNCGMSNVGKVACDRCAYLPSRFIDKSDSSI